MNLFFSFFYFSLVREEDYKDECVMVLVKSLGTGVNQVENMKSYGKISYCTHRKN